MPIIIHRMQIWRTTRSAPGTSLMKARLVGLWCFVLTMFPQRGLASSSIWTVLFRCGYELLCFWTPRERILIFHRSPLRENSGSMQFVEKKERSSIARWHDIFITFLLVFGRAFTMPGTSLWRKWEITILRQVLSFVHSRFFYSVFFLLTKL